MDSNRDGVGFSDGGGFLVTPLRRFDTHWVASSTEAPRGESVEPPPVLLRGTLAFLASLCSHIALFLVLALIPLMAPVRPTTLQVQTLSEPPPETPQAFAVSELPAEELGALSEADQDEALALAADISPITQIPSELEVVPVMDAKYELKQEVFTPSSPHFHERLQVRGAAGHGVTGVSGAMDRLTQEIILSLEERPTIVVWIFDQSASLLRQRQWFESRIKRIYSELGVLEKSGHQAFRRSAEQPLWTSVVSFGQSVHFHVDRTADVDEIEEAIASIQLDPSGVERVFTAVYQSALKYKRYRHKSSGGYQQRNVMLVVFTDEAGNDTEGVDDTVALCQKYAMPVYVVGAPAPFGRRETTMKWVDPDPNYSQQPQWVRIEQGPETFLPERLKLHFAGSGNTDALIDSGFGPFALTRLCVETGGIFFTAHPNRRVGRSISKRETEPFASHLERFFDPKVMEKYQPDYVSGSVYLKRLRENQARAALVKAAKLSWVAPLQSPRLRFVKRDEATFARELTEAQKGPAKLEPQVEFLYRVLKEGEKDREQEAVPRWQAGYDLAMGRVLAILVRTQSYNAMLAKAKRGMKFQNAKNNTWTLTPSNEITVSTKLKGAADKARQYLQRVVEDHPGTPWAYLAQKELDIPLGWTWKESYTNLNPPRRNRPGNNNNNRPRMPRDDQPRSIKPPPPKRKPPRV